MLAIEYALCVISFFALVAFLFKTYLGYKERRFIAQYNEEMKKKYGKKE